MKYVRTAVFSVPVFGWLLRSAWYGNATEKVFFLINLVLLWAFAIYRFGYPALILPALLFAGSYLLFLVIFTAGDMRNGQS